MFHSVRCSGSEHGFWSQVAQTRFLYNLRTTLNFLCLSFLIGSQQTVKRHGNTRPPYLPPEKSVCRSRSMEMNMEQQTGSKWEKEYVKAVYCHPAYLTYMQSISCEMPGWMKHKLESRLPGEISITSDMQMIPPLWQKVKKN